MNSLSRLWVLASAVMVSFAASNVGATGVVADPTAAEVRDGQRDFDFNLGTWNTKIQRRAHPLSGSAEFFEMSGTVTVRGVWGGRAQLEEIEVDGPKGHWQALTLFVYNPQSGQWSQTFVNSANGAASSLVGGFTQGRGELYAQDVINGRSVLVRGVWSDISLDAHRYEESYSIDGGRTWESVFLASLTRKAQ